MGNALVAGPGLGMDVHDTLQMPEAVLDEIALQPCKETPFIESDGNEREKYQLRHQNSKTLMLDDFNNSNSSEPSNHPEPPAEVEVPQVTPMEVEGEAPASSSEKAELQEPEDPAMPSPEEA